MQYEISKVNIGERKTFKSGKMQGKGFYSVGFQIGGTWHNNIVAEVDTETLDWCRGISPGDKVEIILDEKPKDGGGVWNNWKLPNKTDKLEARVSQLEEVVKQLVKHTKLVYRAPQKEQPKPKEEPEYDDSDLPF